MLEFISSFLLLSLFPLTSIGSHLQSFNPHPHPHILNKRGDAFHGRATFYATGLGSCGDTNTDSDYIVALNQAQYDSSWCGKTITISYGGKSTQALVKDLCPGCPMGGLDMSPSLFKYFASEDVGVFYMSWSVGGGGGGDDKPKEKPAPVHVPPPAPAPEPSHTPAPAPPPKQDPPKEDNKPDPPKTDDKSDPSKTDDKSDSSKTEDKPDYKPNPAQTSSSSSVPVSTSVNLPTSTPWNFNRSSTSTNNLDSGKVVSTTTTTSGTSNTVAVSKGFVPTVYGQVEVASAYDTGGNLDIVSQLIISFGSLTAASASHAISQTP